MKKIHIDVMDETCEGCPGYVFQAGGTGLCIFHWRQIHKKDEEPKIPEWCWLPELDETLTVKQAIDLLEKSRNIAKKKSKRRKK